MLLDIEPFLEAHDRLFLAPDLDLCLVAVELGVEHGMCAEPIGTTLEEIGLAGFADRVHGTAAGGLHGNDVHAVHGFR